MSLNPHQPDIDTFLPFMHDVGRCRQALHELGLMWRMIEGSARMNCPEDAGLILPTIEAARQHFDALELELVRNLVAEKVSAELREITKKAHYVIDIVVRNLYERTADVGFLATDLQLRHFMASGGQDIEGARQRLQAYRCKYTVYDAILLVAPDGTVLAAIGDGALPEHSTDPLIAQALQHDSYLQAFRNTSLQPDKTKALIYCQRMLAPDGATPAGVLFLSFNLEEEMRGIFESHRSPQAHYNMLLLDETGECIASADPAWIAPGQHVPMNINGEPRLLMHAGRQYLVATHGAAGYQGYEGPKGWHGQVMIPAEIAFATSEKSLEGLTADMKNGLRQHADTLCPPLRGIMTAAEAIRRVVWNGQVITKGTTGNDIRLQAILDQVRETGDRSNRLFQTSIQDLYDTVLAANMQDARGIASLMVDLLDRNLYERANDCRWWALDALLQQAAGTPQHDTLKAARSTLNAVNALYTVYTSIFLYDAKGQVLAHSSRDATGHDYSGTSVAPHTLRAVLALSDPQGYVVEPFGAAPAYPGTATYVYHAALHKAGDSGRAIGGIGLVFDSDVELPAMLQSALAGKSRTFALFTDRNGTVIACSNDSLRPGDKFLAIPDMLSLPNGASASRLMVHKGHYVIVACSVSQGYREFKRTDTYRDDVVAVVIETLGPSSAPDVLRSDPHTPGQNALATEARRLEVHNTQRFASFLLGGRVYAIAADNVLEAIPANRMVTTASGTNPLCAGVLHLSGKRGKELVWVYNLSCWLSPSNTAREGDEVIVLCQGERRIGLRVNALHTVEHYEVASVGGFADESGRLIWQVISAADGGMIPVLDAGAIFQRLDGTMIRQTHLAESV